ncbi:tripartite tricarboxylate transporter substrate binding protein [Alcaligenaceae bacterium]|nr:tripartite tricarboxylate transporter substrate binding protein [Alcaligenaceae bacterium]
MSPRKITTLISASFLIAFSGTATAQTAWPEKPIKFVVGAAAGGSASDSITRFFAERIHEATGQAGIIENKPGADGNIAASHVARAAPDGYTLLVTGNNTHAANTHLYKTLPFDPDKDFAPVTTYARVPYVLLINPERVAARSFKDFIAYAQANSGQMTYASAALASRVGVEQLKLMANFKATNINYKSGAQAMTDLIGGHVDFYIADAVNGLAQARAGRAIALAVTVNERLQSALDIPTIAESGFPDYNFFSWLAVWAPAQTPPKTVQTLSGLINNAMESNAGKQFLGNAGLLPYPGSPEALAALQKSETKRWGQVIKAAGLAQK